MGWKVIEIRTDEYMKLYLNNLMIQRVNEKILINLSDIDTLIVENHRSSVSINLLNALARHHVNVIFMDAKHEPNSYLVPINGHHNSLKVLEKQIQWSHQYKGFTWSKIVKNKIYNQGKHLQIHGKEKPKDQLHQFIDHVESFDVTNREGHAAKVYWNRLFGTNFIRDQSAIKFPIINSILNYGYAILRSLFIKSIIKVGLDPRISLFHKSFTNFFALSSDLMEPLRPLIDQIAFKHQDDPFFKYEVKEEIIEIWNKKIKINNQCFFLNKGIDKLVEALNKGKGWLWVDIWD